MINKLLISKTADRFFGQTEGKIPTSGVITLYRGTPGPETTPKPRAFAAVFFSIDPKAAQQYGKHITKYTLPMDWLHILDIDGPEAIPIAKEYMEIEGWDKQGPLSDDFIDDFMSNYFLFPDKGWVKFLMGKGFVGTSLGGDLALFGQGLKWLNKAGPKTASVETEEFPLAGPQVDGLTVGGNIANMSSISASMYDYEIEDGIREVSMSFFNAEPHQNFYAKNDFDRCEALAEEIKASGKIDPLIVGVDKEGPYVLEGGHRLVALHLLGKKALPALVVKDLSDEWIAQRGGKTAASPYVYHVTPESNLPEISEHGLLAEKGRKYYDDIPPSNYLIGPRGVNFWKEEVTEEFEPPIVVLRVPRNKLRLGKDEQGTYDARAQAYRTKGDIPPQLIEVRGEDGRWRPIKTAIASKTAGVQDKRKSAGVSPSQLPISLPIDQTQTPEFKRWFRGSVVKDPKGNPLPVYHGSTHQFEVFNAQTSDPENHYGKAMYFTSSEEDVTRNYATPTGPDITNRIDRKTDELMRQLEDELGKGFPAYSTTEYSDLRADANERAIRELTGEGEEGMIYLTYLRIEKPVIVSRTGGTYFEINYNEHTEQESGSGVRLYNAVLKVGQKFGVDGYEVWKKLQKNGELTGDFTAYKFEQEFRGCENLPEEVYVQPGNYIAQVYRTMGFDGIVQMEADQQFRNMGITPGTTHYIVWNPRQVKSAVKNKGTFNSRSPRMTASQEDIEEVQWTKPLYHATTAYRAKKIKQTQNFESDNSGGYDEMGYGVYVHPSMNRTAPWTGNGRGAFIELNFTKPLRLVVKSERMPDQRELIDLGFDGIYDKYGLTQIPHQVLLFNHKPIITSGTGVRRTKELIDWAKVKVIVYNEDLHGYTRGFDTPEEARFYRGDPHKIAAFNKLPEFDEIYYIYYPDTAIFLVVGFQDGKGVFSEQTPVQKLQQRYGDKLAIQMVKYEGEVVNQPKMVD